MTDKQKLSKIIKYLKTTRKALDRCMDKDHEYNNSLGNGLNAFECSGMFEEVEEVISGIINEKDLTNQ